MTNHQQLNKTKMEHQLKCKNRVHIEDWVMKALPMRGWSIMAMVKTFDIDMDAIIGSLPCPFCGSETMIEGHPFGDSATEGFRVTCEQNGHSLDRWDSTKRAAIVAWNKRP